MLSDFAADKQKQTTDGLSLSSGYGFDQCPLKHAIHLYAKFHQNRTIFNLPS